MPFTVRVLRQSLKYQCRRHPTSATVALCQPYHPHHPHHHHQQHQHRQFTISPHRTSAAVSASASSVKSHSVQSTRSKVVIANYGSTTRMFSSSSSSDVHSGRSNRDGGSSSSTGALDGGGNRSQVRGGSEGYNQGEESSETIIMTNKETTTASMTDKSDEEEDTTTTTTTTTNPKTTLESSSSSSPPPPPQQQQQQRIVYVHPLSQIILEYLQDRRHDWIVQRGLETSLKLHRDGSFELKTPRAAAVTTTTTTTTSTTNAASDGEQGLGQLRESTNSSSTTPTSVTPIQTQSATRIWTYYDEQEKKHWLSVHLEVNDGSDGSHDGDTDAGGRISKSKVGTNNTGTSSSSSSSSLSQRFLLQDNLLPAWHGNRKSLPERIHVAVDELIRSVQRFESSRFLNAATPTNTGTTGQAHTSPASGQDPAKMVAAATSSHQRRRR